MVTRRQKGQRAGAVAALIGFVAAGACSAPDREVILDPKEASGGDNGSGGHDGSGGKASGGTASGGTASGGTASGGTASGGRSGDGGDGSVDTGGTGGTDGGSGGSSSGGAGSCECTAPAKDCFDNGVRTCGPNCQWSGPSACNNQTCVAGECVGSCAPGQKTCVLNGLKTCGPDGEYGTAVACSHQTCVTNACVGTCAPGEKKCASVTGYQLCGPNGTFDGQPTTACVDQACASDACTGSCTPRLYSCRSGVGYRCNDSGSFVSNGSANPCNCYVPGRFTFVSSGLVLDTTTNLTWDVNERAAANWVTASGVCDGAGMRLPTLKEWKAVALTALSATCPFMSSPFDNAAMPTSVASGVNVAKYWSSDPFTSSGTITAVYTADFNRPPSAGNWLYTSEDYPTTASWPYRCVK